MPVADASTKESPLDRQLCRISTVDGGSTCPSFIPGVTSWEGTVCGEFSLVLCAVHGLGSSDTQSRTKLPDTRLETGYLDIANRHQIPVNQPGEGLHQRPLSAI